MKEFIKIHAMTDIRTESGEFTHGFDELYIKKDAITRFAKSKDGMHTELTIGNLTYMAEEPINKFIRLMEAEK